VAWGPSAIYSTVHIGGYRVEDLRINDAVMEKARKGQENYRQKICIAFRERIRQDTGRDCGWVNYDYLVFTKLRDVPAPVKKKGTS
jgi:hypothetical protein